MVLDHLHPNFGVRRGLALRDSIYARNFVGHLLWLPGKVVGITGPCSYRVELTDGQIWRHHIDYLRSHGELPVQTEPEGVSPENSVPAMRLEEDWQHTQPTRGEVPNDGD